jgi:hypothetical protein
LNTDPGNQVSIVCRGGLTRLRSTLPAASEDTFDWNFAATPQSIYMVT